LIIKLEHSNNFTQNSGQSFRLLTRRTRFGSHFTFVDLFVMVELRRLERGQAKVGDLEREATVHHTVGTRQVPVTLDLTTVDVDHSFNDVMNQVVLEIDLKLNGLVLQNVLKAALLTKLGEYELTRRLQANADEPRHMIVLHIF
jgi:hypothetical protein